MIRVDNLYKSFAEVKAVQGISFHADNGKITGLLGPNGAGKSTTLRILYTVLKPDSGSAFIDGVDVVTDGLAARAQIGTLPHGSGLYPHLSARENIAYYAKLYEMPADTIDGILREISVCRAAHPNHIVRVIGYDNSRRALGARIVVRQHHEQGR